MRITTVRTTREDRELLDKATVSLNEPQSQIIRRALRREFQRLELVNPNAVRERALTEYMNGE